MDQNSPILEGELPLDGSRFEGFFPPVVPNPSFSIRKKASKIFTLQEYVEARIMTPEVSAYLSQAIDARKNILVVGGTGSGKTTLTNAVLAELAAICPDDRLVLIEDTGELQNSSRNKLSLHYDPDNHHARSSESHHAGTPRPNHCRRGPRWSGS